MAELLFDPLALADVGIDFEVAAGLAFWSFAESPAARYREGRTVLSGMDELSLPAGCRRKLALDFRQRFRENGLQQTVGASSERFFARPPVHRGGAVIPEADCAIPIDRYDGIVRQVQKLCLLADGG